MAAFQRSGARPPPSPVKQAGELPTTVQPYTKSEDPPLWNEFSPISEQSLDRSKRQLATGSDSGQLHAQETEDHSSTLHIPEEKRSQITESQQSLKIKINGLEQERKRLRDENESLRIENEKLREENKSLKQAKRPRYDHSQQLLTTETQRRVCAEQNNKHLEEKVQQLEDKNKRLLELLRGQIDSYNPEPPVEDEHQTLYFGRR